MENLGDQDAARSLHVAMVDLSTAHRLLGQGDESVPRAIDAYRIVAATDLAKIGKERLQRSSLQIGYGLGYRQSAAPSRGAAPSAVACDREAGHPYDPLLLGDGTGFFLVEPDAALEACAKALSEEPHNPRYIFQHGRALDKKSRTANDNGHTRAESTKAYKSAMEKGYAIAFNNLASGNDNATATQADREEVPKLYLEIFNRIVDCCGRDVARHLLERPDGPNRDALARGALDMLEWAAELGDASAHEEVARVLADEALARLKSEWAELAPSDRAAMRVTTCCWRVRCTKKQGARLTRSA